MKATARESRIEKGPAVQRLMLLQMAESLIAAHKAAKIDDDGYKLDLIDDAMRHVGKRLAKEAGDGRSFDLKRPRTGVPRKGRKETRSRRGRFRLCEDRQSSERIRTV